MPFWKLLFERQPLHALLLGLLLVFAAWTAREESFSAGELWSVPTAAWFWLSIAVPIAHQTYVLFCWRLQLHTQSLTRRFGEKGFRIYAAGFAVLGLSRLATLALLAAANRDTLDIDRTLAAALALVLGALAAYLFYSVARYFTFRRACGIDHFDPSYRTKPLVREGIFRYTRNGMYTFGLLVLWAPGLLAASKAALLSALFGHLYIWVHYYCTELPDMRRIYGPAESE